MNPGDMLFAASLMSRKIESLTGEEIKKVAKTFLNLDVVVSPELRDAALELLRTQDIHMAADIIQSPAAVQELVMLLKGQTAHREPPKRIHQCPHCSLFSFIPE